jgi:prepilin-type processing-associated H-X9-DG protein
VVGIDLAHPGFAVGGLNIDATNIVFGDGHVFFQSGTTIYESSPDLVGLTVFAVNGAAPLGLAILPPELVSEPATIGVMLAGLLGLAAARGRRGQWRVWPSRVSSDFRSRAHISSAV